MLEIKEKIEQCNTMPKLDALRLEVLKSMKANNGVHFEEIQNCFIKQKNKLNRIPLKDRRW